MPFSDFKNTLEVAQEYQLALSNKRFLPQNLTMPLSELFLEDLEYSLKIRKPNPSEIAICENLISPMIRLIARKHPHLIFWSREYDLYIDEKLCGKPDYLFSYTENPDEINLGMPLVCVSEAKVDDFVKAWGQTLAEMVACQKLFPEITLYGWATNGTIWEFGKLENNVFTQHNISYSIGESAEKIAGILDWIFKQAVQQAQNYLKNNA